jgi:hypothetical protein
VQFSLPRFNPKKGMLILPVLLIVLAGCWPFTQDPLPSSVPTHVPTLQTGPSQIGALSPVIDAVAQQVLTNMHLHGWNPHAVTHGKVTGGLYTNWKMSDPTITNALGVGPSDQTQSKHDIQVDLFYLMSLADYHQLHLQDRAFDFDLDRITRQVLEEFQTYNLPKGWIYFFLLRSGLALNNSALVNEAHDVAGRTYTKWYDPTLGVIYNRNHSPGDYSPNLTLQAGAALIDAGFRWKQPAWVSAGEKTMDHVISAALNPQYHMFSNNMIVESDGHDQVTNYQAKPSTQGEAASALITAYTLTHNQHYLDVADQILQSVFGSNGLWDQQRGGLFFAFDMQKGKVLDSYKETRSQDLVLVSIHKYDLAVAKAQFAQQEQQLVSVLTNQFYQHTYRGYFYRVTPDFRIYVDKPGSGIGVEDFFTTEAMGSTLDALQQTEFAKN